MTDQSAQNKNDICQVLEEDISFTNKLLQLLQSNVTDSQVSEFQELFSKYIQNTKYKYNYFIGLLEHFAHIRPKHKHIVPKLYETILSLFPTNKTDIKNKVRNNSTKIILQP